MQLNRVILPVTMALLCIAGPATAQGPSAADGPPTGAPVDSAEPAAEPEGVEAITVTGEQLDVTDIQDEAQAISAFSMDELDKMNIGNVDALAYNVPGLHVGQQGQAAIITLRGVGTENASITGEPGVAFHVDGINYGRPTAARVAFFDLEGIQVKRGPQGLIGGKNSTSGAINVVTNDPTSEYEVNGDVLFGNYDRVRGRGHVNLPLGELLAIRTAFFYEDRDGFLDNKLVSDSRDPFDLDNFGMRTKLRLMPSDSIDIVLGYNYFKETGNGPQADLVPIPTPATELCPGGVSQGYISPDFVSVMPSTIACKSVLDFTSPTFRRHTPGIEDDDPRSIYSSTSSQDNRYWGFSGKVDWELPELPVVGATQLKLLGGYQRTETAFNYDFDASALDLFDLITASEVHEHSGDLQWSGHVGERFNWQTSFFFMRQKGQSLTVTPVFLGNADPTTGARPSNVGDSDIRSFQDTLNKSYGAAIHGEFHLSPSVTFSTGARWIKDDKWSYLRREQVAGGLEACVGAQFGGVQQPDGTVTAPELPDCELTERATMWGARVEWRPMDDMLWYAGIDRGFKSGGFGTGGVGRYLPERIWAYTLGTKTEFLDRRLQINLEGFFYAYDDMQIALIDGTRLRTENADTRMHGVELEARLNPIPGLQLRGIFNFIKTEVIEYYSLDPAARDDTSQISRLTQRQTADARGEPFPGDRPCAAPGRTSIDCADLGDRNGFDDFAGNELSRSPEWKYSFSAEYEIPLGRFGTLTPFAQYTWQDDTYYRVFNRAWDLQEDFHKTDLKLIWRSPADRYTAEIFVENVEDEAAKQNILIGPTTFGRPPLAWYSQPRMYGVMVGFRY